MEIKGLINHVLPFSQVCLNLADSPYHLEPDQATILQNMDFDDNRSALAGRYGSTTLNPDGILLHDGINVAWYEMFDLYRAEDPDTGKKYVVGVYDDGNNYKIGYMQTNAAKPWTMFHTLRLVGGGALSLTRGYYVNFCSARCPVHGDIVFGFNGYDQPWYASFTSLNSQILQVGRTAVGAASFTAGIDGGLNDLTAGGTYTGTSNASYVVEIDGGAIKAHVGTPAFHAVETGDLDDMTAQGTFSGVADTNYRILIDTGIVDGFTTAPVFTGGLPDLNDINVAGSYSAVTSKNYIVEIDGNTGPLDSFRWSDDNGATWTREVFISGGPQNLSNGVWVLFGAITGHTLLTGWTFTGTPAVTPAQDKFSWSDDGGITWDAQNVNITGAAQALNNGVTVTFGAITGHKQLSYWDFTSTVATAHTPPDTFKWSKDGLLQAEGIPCTVAAQTSPYSDGVSVAFGAVTGHTLGDSWTIATTITNGLNDASVTGIFTGAAAVKYAIKITTAPGGGGQDKFKLSIDDGATYPLPELDCLVGGVSIGDGLTVKFAAITGHTVDDVWKWESSPQGATFFAIGGTAVPALDYRLEFIYPKPFHGHLFACLRTGELTTWQWSSTKDFTVWIADPIDTTMGFRQAPPQEPTNPIRGAAVMQNRFIAFNLDSIGELVPTGVTSTPFVYQELIRGAGTIHFKAVVPWQGRILFLDKSVPYLKMFNGSQLETLDPTGSIQKGFQAWMDVSVAELLKTRLDVKQGNLIACFKSQPPYAKTGTDGKRWMAVVNLTRTNNQGVTYFPFNLWTHRANDVLCANESTDVGFCWFSDSEPQGGKYYVRRMLDWFDVKAGGVGFGDNRGLVDGTGKAIPAKAIKYLFRTGWQGFTNINTLTHPVWKETVGVAPWKEFMLFRLHGEWEGTPSTGAKFYVHYRCEGWTAWQTLEINAVAVFAAAIPFAPNAQGRMMQFEFEYEDNASRPILNQIEIGYVVKRGVLN